MRRGLDVEKYLETDLRRRAAQKDLIIAVHSSAPDLLQTCQMSYDACGVGFRQSPQHALLLILLTSLVVSLW